MIVLKDSVQDLITSVRRHAGLTQEELARKRGVSRTAQQAIETQRGRSIGWENISSTLLTCDADVILNANMLDNTSYSVVMPCDADRGGALISQRLKRARMIGSQKAELVDLGDALAESLQSLEGGDSDEWFAWLGVAMMIVNQQSTGNTQTDLERVVAERSLLVGARADGQSQAVVRAEVGALLDYLAEMFIHHEDSVRFSPVLSAAPDDLSTALNRASGDDVAQQLLLLGYLVLEPDEPDEPDPRAFVVDAVSGITYKPDGTVEEEVAPGVWTLAHRGYSGAGRLDVWVYPSESAAQHAGAALALACGLTDQAPAAETLFENGDFAAVMALYERHSPADHILRVQTAWFCDEGDHSFF